MPEARVWTTAADSVICAMREGGETWAAIGQRLGLSRNTVIERGRRLRAAAPPKVVLVTERAVSEDPNRLPLPAGHPVTWRLISEAPYPDCVRGPRISAATRGNAGGAVDAATEGLI